MSEKGVILSKEKLLILAKLINRQEEERIKSIPFRSVRDRVDYLRYSRETHDMAVALLNEKVEALGKNKNNGSDPNSDPNPDPLFDDVVQNYLAYLEAAVGVGLQALKNVNLRHDFLKKVRGHADTLVVRMKAFTDGSITPSEIEIKAKALIEELVLQKNILYKSVFTKADPSSKSFSQAIKFSGYSFEDLVNKYKMKLVREKGPEFDKPFEHLADEQKIEVYDEILKASGRGTFLTNTAYRVADVIGKGLILFTLALAVWDIYSSEHKLQAIVTEGAEFGLGWVGGSVGEILGGGLATYLITTVGIAESAVTAAFVGLAAFISGIGLGIALGVLAGFVVGKIFESGGKHAGGAITVNQGEPIKKPPVPTHHLHVYVAPMPDGALLARQLAYKGAPSTAIAPSTAVAVF